MGGRKDRLMGLFWIAMTLPSGKVIRVHAFTLRGLALMVRTMRTVHGAA